MNSTIYLLGNIWGSILTLLLIAKNLYTHIFNIIDAITLIVKDNSIGLANICIYIYK